MPTKSYPRLNFAPHWQMPYDNLIELIDLVPEEKLDWSPAPSEWSLRVIVTHIILARYHDPIAPAREGAQMSEVVFDCRTKEGLKKHLGTSWDMVAAFLSDSEKLDAVHEPITWLAPEYTEPEVYDGHYIAYHRMAHDLHHRSTSSVT
jgi:DinB family